MTETMPTLKAIHICNSHQPTHRQKLQKSMSLPTLTDKQDGRTPACNSTYKKLAVQWLNEVPFSNQTFVQVDSFVLRNCHLRVAPIRQVVKKLTNAQFLAS